MKLFSNAKILNFICSISLFFFGCQSETVSIENKIEKHKNNIYLLNDSLKMIDQKIDSVLKIYSKKNK